MSLLSRLEKLEQSFNPPDTGYPKIIIVRWGDTGQEVTRMKHGESLFVRQASESEPEFKARAESTVRSRSGDSRAVYVFIEDTEATCNDMTIIGLADDMPLEGIADDDIKKLAGLLRAQY